MNSLVADYGGGSSGSASASESESGSGSESDPAAVEREADVRLPKPDFDGSSAMSVFTNPFAEAENAKKAILEKHVKMVPSGNGAQTINGKKVCWNYRKGRCRFGHTCTFAHDSDLRVTDERHEVSENNLTRSDPRPEDENRQSAVENEGSDQKIPRKKRPGLGDSIVPGKKAMKFYKQKKLKISK